MPDREIRRNGNANVRVRAVQSLRILEWAELIASDGLKGVRQVGRHLYLAYEAKEDRFRWRKLGGRGHIQAVLGARLPREWWARLYRPTREQVASIERLLETRTGLRRALNLAAWMGEHWREIEAEVLQVEWRMPTAFGDCAGVKWTVVKNGGIAVRRSYHIRSDGIATGCAYLPHLTQKAAWELSTREEPPPAGLAVAATETVVRAVERQHEKLVEWRAHQGGALRVYWAETQDLWRWQRMRGMAGAAVAMNGDAMAAVITAPAGCDPQLAAKWEDYLLWRRGRRVLLLLALLGEGAIQFPVGGWVLRGRGAKDERWGWIVSSLGRSVLRRQYRDALSPGMAEDEDGEGETEGSWKAFGWE